MNPLLREASSSVGLGWVLGIMTVVFLTVFLAWAWWAYAPKNRSRMEAAALMPLADDDSEGEGR